MNILSYFTLYLANDIVKIVDFKDCQLKTRLHDQGLLWGFPNKIEFRSIQSYRTNNICKVKRIHSRKSKKYVSCLYGDYIKVNDRIFSMIDPKCKGDGVDCFNIQYINFEYDNFQLNIEAGYCLKGFSIPINKIRGGLLIDHHMVVKFDKILLENINHEYDSKRGCFVLYDALYISTLCIVIQLSKFSYNLSTKKLSSCIYQSDPKLKQASLVLAIKSIEKSKLYKCFDMYNSD